MLWTAEPESSVVEALWSPEDHGSQTNTGLPCWTSVLLLLECSCALDFPSWSKEVCNLFFIL